MAVLSTRMGKDAILQDGWIKLFCQQQCCCSNNTPFHYESPSSAQLPVHKRPSYSDLKTAYCGEQLNWLLLELL